MSAMQGAVSAAERSMRSVFVGNIPYEATEEQLKDIFSEVGPVVSFRLVYDRETGKPKGYGFCEYKDQEMALSAMRNLNGYELNGRALRVDNAASEKSKEELKNLQAAMGGPPVESPFGEAVPPELAPERIARIVSSMPPEQLFGLMIEMKQCIENNPNESRTLLVQNPQLTYALLQAQVIMKMVEPEMAMGMLHTKSGAPIGFTATEPKPAPVANPQVPQVPVSDMNNIYQAGPPHPSNMPAVTNPVRPPVVPPQVQRNSMMGERPLPMPAPPIPPMASQFAGAPHGMSDHDLRGPAMPPMADHDMRGPPMMPLDKDMRHPMGDQDFRGAPQPGGQFPDPRYRNAPGPDMMVNQRPPYDNRRPVPEARPGFDGRGPVPMQPRMEEVRVPVAGGMSSPVQGRMAVRYHHYSMNPRMAPPNAGSPVVGTASPVVSSPRPNNPFAAAAAAIAPHDQEKAALIMQVLQLTDAQIALLPPEQRQSIMVLKEQIARSQQAT